MFLNLPDERDECLFRATSLLCSTTTTTTTTTTPIFSGARLQGQPSRHQLLFPRETKKLTQPSSGAVEFQRQKRCHMLRLPLSKIGCSFPPDLKTSKVRNCMFLLSSLWSTEAHTARTCLEVSNRAYKSKCEVVKLQNGRKHVLRDITPYVLHNVHLSGMYGV